MGIVFFIHTIICIFLAVVILMQTGRGGGLTESFSSAESMFGAKTNAFMIKATTVLASIFLVTCLSLAVLSSKKSSSLMAGQATSAAQTSAATGSQAMPTGEGAAKPAPAQTQE